MTGKRTTVLGGLTVAIVAAVGLWLTRAPRQPERVDPQAAAEAPDDEGAPEQAGGTTHDPVPAPAPAAGDPAWAARTERALTDLAEARLGTEARLDSVACAAGSCRLELSHRPTPAGGQRVQELLSSAMELLPDSVTQPDVAPGKTVVTLSLAPETAPRLPRGDDDTDPRGGRVWLR